MIGASVDNIRTCKCNVDCQDIVVEYKCPWKHRDQPPKEAVLTPEIGGTVIKRDQVLKKTAPYYYQVQVKIFVTGLSCCDFVVRTKKLIFVASIIFDKEFMASLCKKVESFWYGQVFPAMVNELTNNDSAPNKAAATRFCFLSLFSTKLQSLTLLLKQFSKNAYGPLPSHPFSNYYCFTQGRI